MSFLRVRARASGNNLLNNDAFSNNERLRNLSLSLCRASSFAAGDADNTIAKSLAHLCGQAKAGDVRAWHARRSQGVIAYVKSALCRFVYQAERANCTRGDSRDTKERAHRVNSRGEPNSSFCREAKDSAKKTSSCIHKKQICNLLRISK